MSQNDVQENAESSLALALGGDKEAFGRLVTSQRQSMLRARQALTANPPLAQGHL